MNYKIILADSSDMREVESNSVSLIVTSPPYYGSKIWIDMMEEQGLNREDKIEEFLVFHDYLRPVWEECYRVLSPGSKMVVNIGNIDGKARLYGRWDNAFMTKKNCYEIGFRLRENVPWLKYRQHQPPYQGSFPRPWGVLWSNLWEHNIVFQKPGTRSYRNMPNVIKEISKLTRQDARDLTDYNYWKFGSASGVHDGKRFAPFPLELPYRFVKLLSYVNDIVLDPFGGTGTTLLACRLLNRNCIIYEINDSCIPVIEENCRFSEPNISEISFDTSQDKIELVHRS
jgi:site-specific DNA-methyltransferase (adenine-specific)